MQETKIRALAAISALATLTACSSGGSGAAAETGGSGGSPTTAGGSVGASGAGTLGGSPGMGGSLGSGGFAAGFGGASGQTNSGGVASGGGSSTGTGGSPAGGGTTTGGVAGSGGGGAGAGAGAGSTTGGIGGGGGGSTSLGGATAAGSGGAPGGAGGSGGTPPQGGATSALIQNDVFWKDTSGNPIYSQGGGVLQVGSTYYWYGVRYGGAATYAQNPTKSNSDTSFVAVTIYSSSDLANWKFEGNALTMASVSASVAMDSGTWIGRVGAAYNTVTKKFVLNGQYLGTPDTSQFFATSDTPNGAFKWDHTQAVITNVTNSNCGDQSVFTDDDGKAYILCSSLSGRSNTYIVPLRPSDFLEAQPATRIFGGAGREGNAMFKYKGRYYVCSSDLHGWNASHAYYISATNILGPYGAESVIGGTGLDFSHVTQTGLFVTVKGSSQETVIFGGDRWSDFAGNGIGFNDWMPLTFDGTSPAMQSFSEWSINTATGAFSVGPGNNYALNPSFEADRVSTTAPAGWSTMNGTNVSGGHTGRWSWQLSGASSVEQKLTGIPNGTYTLAVWVKGSAGTLSAKGFGGADKSAPIAAATAFTRITLSGIVVSNGTCQIGVSASSGTLSVDDFSLSL